MDRLAIDRMKFYIKHELLIERRSKPDFSKMSMVEVKGKKFYYEKMKEDKFGPSYKVYGRSGARYGLFRGSIHNELFALNLRSKKVVSSVGRFVERDGKIIWKKSIPMQEVEQIDELKKGAEGKNLHMEHLEDRVLDLGAEGASQSLRFLDALGASLSGTAEKPYNITVKWDGAPAIFAGIEPESKKFFIGTKSVFNANPKLNFTHDDINANHEGGLAQKLHVALDLLSTLGIEGVLQGDMMYTKDDLKKSTAGGEEVITFQPNTIVYAVPTDSDLAKEILQSDMGIVFHTTYEGGPTLQDMKAKFGADISKLNKNPKVWVQDANYRDVSGMATLTKKETLEVKSLIDKAKEIFTSNSESFDVVSNNEDVKTEVKVFNNSKVRGGTFIENPKKHAVEFIKYYHDKGMKKVDSVKSEKAKQEKMNQLNAGIDYIKSNISAFTSVFQFMTYLVKAKNIIIKKLQQGESLTKTFIRTDDGLQATTPEGFVAIDHDGAAVKLVDRLEFSTNNFNAAKNWSKPGAEQKTEESINEEMGDSDSIDGLTPVILVSGRFQGFQKGHDSLIQEAKANLSRVGAEKVAILIVEGKNTTGDPKNPLTGEERIQMLSGIYKSDPQVVVIQTPSPIGFIVSRNSKGVMNVVAEDGYYIKGWMAGSDRAPEYQKMIDNLKNKESYQQDVINQLGYLPVERDDSGQIQLDLIIVDRDESGEGSGLGSIENFENKDNKPAKKLFEKIVSTKEPIIPKEAMSGSIVRNLIKVWNIPFDSWYKEVVPPMYNNSSSKKGYRILYNKLVSIMKAKKEESNFMESLSFNIAKGLKQL